MQGIERNNKAIFAMKILTTLAFLLISLPSVAHQNHLLSLVSPNFPPYTYEHNQEVVSIGAELIHRMFANTEIPYKLTIVADYGVVVQVLKAKLADGMFLATQNAERDAIAVFTQPLMMNKWSWYMLADSGIDLNADSFKSQAVVGSIKGTNTEKWLKESGYNSIAHPVEASALIDMLKARRIDAAFVAEAVFEHALDQQVLSQFKKVVEVEKPFGMYISYDYLKKNPNSLAQINRSIELMNLD
ncbi:hypothetical protein NBRC116592_07420 [Colwellia sp. KU-HH00111]